MPRYDALETLHLRDALAWVGAGAPLYRVSKPATPPEHLVSYVALVADEHILLVDHKQAQHQLPTGGHVEPDEDPRVTVVRTRRPCRVRGLGRSRRSLRECQTCDVEVSGRDGSDLIGHSACGRAGQAMASVRSTASKGKMGTPPITV